MKNKPQKQIYYRLPNKTYIFVPLIVPFVSKTHSVQHYIYFITFLTSEKHPTFFSIYIRFFFKGDVKDCSTIKTQ